MPDDAATEAYRRGQAEGEIRARLDGNDRRFDAMNGQLGKIDGRLQDMVRVLQGVQNQTTASVEQQRAVAQALRDQATKAWAPWAKVLAVVGAAGVVASVVIAYVATRG